MFQLFVVNTKPGHKSYRNSPSKQLKPISQLSATRACDFHTCILYPPVPNTCTRVQCITLSCYTPACVLQRQAQLTRLVRAQCTTRGVICGLSAARGFTEPDAGLFASGKDVS